MHMDVDLSCSIISAMLLTYGYRDKPLILIQRESSLNSILLSKMAESPFDNIEFPPLDALPFRKGDPKGKFGVNIYTRRGGS